MAWGIDLSKLDSPFLCRTVRRKQPSKTLNIFFNRAAGGCGINPWRLA
jgi:hypothetical protein